jgi:phosphoribosyl 1,2-cyclic phosphate phosphodiesterase|tara:strand:+ start:1300 stop:2058 length:759 start_codon:yes stop_codon:yes gene_type:complete
LIITFLGTGTSQGVPVIGCKCEVCKSGNKKDKRLRSSVLIQINDKNIIIDTGPDLRQQSLKNNICKIDFVLYTHAHRDHVSGIDELRSFNFIQKEEIHGFGNEELVNQLKKDYSYIFQNQNYPGLPKVNLDIVNGKFNHKGINILPIQAFHYKLKILGYRIHDFTYLTDVKTIQESELNKINGSKILVINCLQINEHISHLNLDEALKLVNKIDVENVYFTHISHNLGLYDKIQSILPKNINLAYDNLQIKL